MKFYKKEKRVLNSSSNNMEFPQIIDKLIYGYALYEVILDNQEKNIDYRFLQVNPSFTEIMELQESDIIGKNASEIFPETYKLLIQKYDQVVSNGKSIKFQQYNQILKKYLEITVINTSLNQFACIYNDMTHCDDIKNRLTNSETRLNSILGNIHNITSILDESGIIRYISPNCEELSGWTQEDCIGKEAWFTVHPENLDRIKDEFQQLLQTENQQITVQCKTKTKDGSYKWMEICATNKSCDTKINGILLSYHYIDEQKKVETILESKTGKLSHPINNAQNVTFEELFDLEDIQRLQDDFAEATGVASVITHIDGTPITKPSRFCRLCSKIIRNTEKGQANCFKSDAYIGSSCKNGPIIQTCLSGGLWDAGAGITIGGRHIANWLIGQVRDETQTEEKMRAYAREIGANEDDVAEAFKEVNSMSRDKFEKISTFLFTLASQLSKYAHQNVQQSRFIFERKKAENALEAEKENLAVTLRSIGDGVITTDNEGKIVTINKVAERLTEWTSTEAAGLPLFDVFNIINQNTRQPCSNPVEKVLKTGDIVELANHTALISRSGKEIIIADSAAPIHNTQSQTIGVVLVFRDMTEKYKLEETMQKTQKLESLGLLAGGIAHDFNNLLGGIFGYIEMAMTETEETQVLNYLSESLNSMDRAKNLTQQLLTFSKGGNPIRKVERLFPFIQENVKFALSGTSVSSDFNVQDDLWLCKFDKNQIAQVIDNITINAQQAMPNGGIIEVSALNISISANEHTGLPAGDYVKISLKDHGIGIPKELLPLIFDPYYTTKSKGHGLGLASCYSIINRHEGCIEVESTPGQGSTFIIYLPAFEEVDETNTKENQSQHKGKGIFLVMDDEDANLEIMKIRLEAFGYKVVLTKEGQEAVDYFKSAKQEGKNVTGMIFDLTVPGGMGGKEAIKKIRVICKDTPAFVASGYSSDPIMAEPEKYGFNASICKPFMSDELAVILQKYLKN